MKIYNIAREKDQNDSFAAYRQLFELPQGVIYLDGNSLGPLTKAAKSRAADVVNTQWGTGLITSWNTYDWIRLPQQVGEKIAPLIGAAVNQVICCDSVSVNLFKVLSGALAMRPERHIVATTNGNFPTDLYVAQGVVRHQGGGASLRLLDEAALESQLSDDIAVLMLTEVNFRTGKKLDMKRITQAAHDKGILVIWDLAHSTGAFAVNVDECQVDFAVGCTYKYLNGGPGAPAFTYIAQRHQQAFVQPVYGWMGHATPFEFAPDYSPSASVSQHLAGTPAVLSMSVLDAALDVFEGIDLSSLGHKAQQLMAFFMTCMAEYPELSSLTMITPQEMNQRGNQLAFRHPEGYAICQAWIKSGVIADFRAPDILRVGFAPLYLSFEDIAHAVASLAQVMSSQAYLAPECQQRLAVT